MSERHVLSVPRTARCFVEGSVGSETREVWYGLHGYGQLADRFLAELGSLAGPERLLVAPEALSRFYNRSGRGPIGASWMTAVERKDEIADYVAYLDAVHENVVGGFEPARLCVLGFSQGAATAARWALLGRVRVDRLILWGADFPPDLDLEEHRAALQRLELFLVVGRSDPMAENGRIDRDVERLLANGIEHRFVLFDGGHELDEETLAALER